MTTAYVIVFGNSINGSSGAFSWTPTEAQYGSYVFLFHATDNHGTYTLSLHDALPISVSEVNSAPTLAQPTDVVQNEQTPIAFSLSGTDADVVAGTPDTVSY